MSAAPAFCRGFPQTLVRVMEESLMGDPHTIFVQEKGGPIPGGYKYIRAKSQNADWWQELPQTLDRPELRRAMERVLTCEPLNKKRREHRWLVEFVKDARKRGWCATFHGKESPLCVDPEPPMKRAKLAPGGRRVWMALPEPEYARLLLDSRAIHESPNLFVTGILHDRWAQSDEREAIREPRFGTRSSEDDGIPF